jgi:uncharacterized protein involved in exopolysaccharide biosynthesis
MGPQQEAATSLLVYLLVLWRRRWLFVSVLALTFASAWAFVLISTPIYRATATVLIESDSPRVVELKDVTPGPGPRSGMDYFLTQTKLIQSRNIVNGAIERLKLRERIPEIRATRDPYGAFLTFLFVEPIKNTQLVTVSFESPDANLAAEVANAVAGGYVKYNVDMKSRMAEEAGAWLQQQVGGLVARADRATAALQAYQTKADLLGIQEQRQIVTSKILAQDRAHLDAQTQRQTAEAKLPRSRGS